MWVDRIRDDFPILAHAVHERPLVYFDNGATTQKPQAVIDRMSHFHAHENANVHRAVHALSERATQAYEHARANIADWIGAQHAHELVFVRGATEGINLLAQGLSQQWQPGDEIVVTMMEHHANFVPWWRLAKAQGLTLKVAPIDAQGCLDLKALEALLTPKTKLLSLMHTSNVLGTINPVKAITAMAHQHGVPVLVDGAQALPHGMIDVVDLDCDYFVLSGHKMYGPTGIGVCYAKAEHWQSMPIYQSGGEMIEHVSLDAITYKEPPFCFEAGTPNVVGAVGLGAAVDYMRKIDWTQAQAHEQALLNRLTQGLTAMPGIRIYGQAPDKAPIVSFAIEGQHPLDVATLLDGYGVAVRAGHHCAMPLLQYFEQPGLIRASLAFYNTQAEVDVFLTSLQSVLAMLQP